MQAPSAATVTKVDLKTPQDAFFKAKLDVDNKHTLAEKPKFKEAVINLLDAEIALLEDIKKNSAFSGLKDSINIAIGEIRNQENIILKKAEPTATDANEAVKKLNSVRKGLRDNIGVKTNDPQAKEYITAVRERYADNVLDAINTNLAVRGSGPVQNPDAPKPVAPTVFAVSQDMANISTGVTKYSRLKTDDLAKSSKEVEDLRFRAQAMLSARGLGADKGKEIFKTLTDLNGNPAGAQEAFKTASAEIGKLEGKAPAEIVAGLKKEFGNLQKFVAMSKLEGVNPEVVKIMSGIDLINSSFGAAPKVVSPDPTKYEYKFTNNRPFDDRQIWLAENKFGEITATGGVKFDPKSDPRDAIALVKAAIGDLWGTLPHDKYAELEDYLRKGDKIKHRIITFNNTMGTFKNPHMVNDLRTTANDKLHFEKRVADLEKRMPEEYDSSTPAGRARAISDLDNVAQIYQDLRRYFYTGVRPSR